MRTYVNTNIDKSIKFQNSIEENLNHAKDLILKLGSCLTASTETLGTSNNDPIWMVSNNASIEVTLRRYNMEGSRLGKERRVQN